MQSEIKILITEDDEDYRETLKDLLSEKKFKITAVDNGLAAEEACIGSSFDLYIVDYNMPILNGEQFVRKLKIREPDAVIIIITGEHESSKIVNIMKLGVFDYLVKPVKLNYVEETVQKALDFRKFLNLQQSRQIQSAKEIQARLQWNEYKRSSINSSTDVTKEILENMNRNLLQGSGIGVQITLINMLDLTKGEKDPEGNYTLPGDIFDTLIANNNFSNKQLSALTNTLGIISRQNLNLKKISAADIIKKIENKAAQLAPYLLEKKNCKINIEYPKGKISLYTDEKFLTSALNELMINAAKYCSPNSIISIFTYSKDGYFFFSFKNSIKAEDNGVPEQYEQLVLEPFFRLSKESEEAFIEFEEEFSIGLGLCVTSFIARKHNGLFWIKNYKDHVSDASDICTIAELGLPFENG